MATDRFTDQMQAYGRWRGELTEAIGKYHKWLESNKLASPEVELRIFGWVASGSHLGMANVVASFHMLYVIEPTPRLLVG